MKHGKIILYKESKGNCGFTFLELMLVISLIAILAVISLPVFNDAHSDFNIETASERIASDFRYAKSYAMKSSKTINVVIDTTAEKYSINDGAALIKHPLKKTDFDVTFTNMNSLANVDLYQVTLNGGGNILNFTPQRTSNGGTIEIRYAGRSKSIVVSQSNAEITVQ